MKKKKGFTLIEVIAVLVIMAVIALIATPLVMSIIRKAKDSADKRSIDAYGRSMEYAVATYMLNDAEFPTSFNDINVEYRGAKVECAVNVVNYDGSIFIDKCAVNGKLVKDSKFSSGYYQVGKDTGNYMFTLYKDVNEVINNTAGNGSSSGNAGSNVSGNGNTSNQTSPTLGTVTYNGLSYYRLPNISVTAGYVALVSEEPLSYEDTVKYAGNIPVANVNGFGVVAYYTSDTCNQSNTEGCKTDYESSNVKAIIAAWAADNLKDGSTATIMTTEYLTNQGYALIGNNTYGKTSNTPNSLFSIGVDYWAKDDNGNVYKGNSTFNVTYPYDVAAIRPIIIAKSSDVKTPANSGNTVNNNANSNSANSVTNNTANDTVKNPYTVDFIIMFISIAVIVVCVIIYVIYMITKNKKDNASKKNATKEENK